MPNQAGCQPDGWRQRLIESELSHQMPLRILVVEDNDLNQELMVRMLRRLGYEADVAHNGLAAIAALQSQGYDLIFMDVQMPEMDGLQATRAIRAGQAGPCQPWIIAVTAGAVGSDREACLSAGMNDFLLKPVEQRVLSLALTRAHPGDLVTQPPLPPAGDQPEASTAESIDMGTLDHLKSTLGEQGDLLLPGLIETFLQSAENLQASAREALAQHDSQTLRRAMHTLKSNASTFGAQRLSALCRDLEQRATRVELEGAGQLLDQVADEYGRVQAALGER